VVGLDAQVVEMEGRAAQARLAHDAIAATVAEARAEASKSVAAVAQTLQADRHSSLRARRAAIIAELPAILAGRLTELVGIERALTAAANYARDLDVTLDELATAKVETPEEASALLAEAVSAMDPPPEEVVEPLSSASLEPSGPRRRKS
jgi:hypothetical protein